MSGVEFDVWLEREMRDPEFAKLLAEERAIYDRSYVTTCAWNLCIHEVDPATGKIHGGFGPVMCPCDHLPGWRSSRVAGQPKPSLPIKPRGRHGSRVQRSRHRHELPDWSDSMGEWLPARSAIEVAV